MTTFKKMILQYLKKLKEKITEITIPTKLPFMAFIKFQFLRSRPEAVKKR